MFTLKHVSTENNETIYPATEVSWVPNVGSGSTDGQGVQSVGCVWRTVPGTGEIKDIQGGTVYVMNETGRTVATYRMSPEDIKNYGQMPVQRPVPTNWLKPDGRIG